jgi:hypothetical protein
MAPNEQAFLAREYILNSLVHVSFSGPPEAPEVEGNTHTDAPPTHTDAPPTHVGRSPPWPIPTHEQSDSDSDSEDEAAARAVSRIDIHVLYENKNTAKRFGALWDPGFKRPTGKRGTWYIPCDADAADRAQLLQLYEPWDAM